MPFLTELLSQEGAAKYHLCTWKIIISRIPSQNCRRQPGGVQERTLRRQNLSNNRVRTLIGQELGLPV